MRFCDSTLTSLTSGSINGSIMSTNVQKISVSISKDIYQELVAFLGKGNISSFITEAAEEKLLEKKLEPKDPVEAFLRLRKVTPKLTHKQIMAAIRKGRM